MKRVLIGGFFSLIGSIWVLPMIFYASENLVSSWPTRLGRLWTTMIQLNIMPMFVAAVVLIAVGITIMVTELFRKEK
ncbi:MAG: hypothetical protein IKZ09_00475 [Clostridia bacterium]|nr:hypothetical protein [Clostridia bacterium]